MNVFDRINNTVGLLLDLIDDFEINLDDPSLQDELEQIENIGISPGGSKQYIVGAFLAPLLYHSGYTLRNWKRFEDDIYPQLKQSYPNIFLYDAVSGVRGGILEKFIVILVNQIFNFDSIFAYAPNNDSNPSELIGYGSDVPVLTDAENKKIIEKIYTAFKISGIPEKRIWGDNDIVIISQKKEVDCICILSCKSSLRERATQSSFWSLRSRLEGKYKHAFCTLDIGSSNGSSEIGNRDQNNEAKKHRDVLESIMDRVYVFRNENEVNRSSSLKGLDYFEVDLERWEADFWGL